MIIIVKTTTIKILSAIFLFVAVIVNAIGNFIGVGDIIPTKPAEETTTVQIEYVDTTDFEEIARIYNDAVKKTGDPLERDATEKLMLNGRKNLFLDFFINMC